MNENERERQKGREKEAEKQEHWMGSMNYGDRGIGSDLLCVDIGYYFFLDGNGSLFGKGKEDERYVTWRGG